MCHSIVFVPSTATHTNKKTITISSISSFHFLHCQLELIVFLFLSTNFVFFFFSHFASLFTVRTNYIQKVGGWRKLWFVLQNQLLLSYSSKEDYEKRLAPFKDVLNLVPGVIVRPTKGPRFTIETPTNLIYTYVTHQYISLFVANISINF